MASPAEQLAGILTDALNQWVKDNPDMFKPPTVNVEGGGSSSGGGSATDLIGIILGIAGLSLLANPELAVVAEGLKEVQGAGGENGTWFGSGWFVGEQMVAFADPFSRMLVHALEASVTSQIFDPDMAADLASRGIITHDQAVSEAAGGGFDGEHLSNMVDAAYNRPTWTFALDMWNRGYINETDVNQTLQYAGVPAYWWPYIKQMRRELLSPADWALAALRKNVTTDQAAAGAAMWGLNADDFDTLMLNTGEPPGTMQLLEAYRRGFIDEATLEKGILQSRVRDEWIPTLEKLRYAPMSTAAAANAVVRGYLSQADGASIAQQNGLEPDHWQYVLESNGRPPSHEQLATLYLRGIISQAQFEQGIRESDIKDKYISDVFDLRVRFLPLFEARTLLNAGEITGKTFTEQLLVQGYEKSVIDEILKAAGTGKKTTAKHLTAADYTELFDTGILDREQTLTGLESIGYDKTDAASIVTIAEAKVAAKLTTQLVTNIRTQFDRYKLTEDEAKQELVDVGVQTAEITRLVDGWAVVRPQGTRTLTEAQVLKALKLKAIVPDDAYNRLRGLGLDDVDARLLMLIDG